MTTWILILVIQGGHSPGSAATTAVFQSKESCEKAAQQLMKDKKSWNSTYNAYCFENKPESTNEATQ